MIKWKKKGRNSSNNGDLYEATVGNVGVGKLQYDNGRRAEYYFRGEDYATEKDLYEAARDAAPDEEWRNRSSNRKSEDNINKEIKGTLADSLREWKRMGEGSRESFIMEAEGMMERLITESERLGGLLGCSAEDVVGFFYAGAIETLKG